MAAPRVVFSRAAAEDLFDIEEYIAAHDGRARAEAVSERIQRTLRRLAFMPGIGRVRADLVGSPRTFLIQSWRVFYRATPRLDGILVIRILDTRRNIDAIMRKKRS